MLIEMVEQPRNVRYGALDTAHGALNAAYNALVVDGQPDAGLARDYVTEARDAVRRAGGHDGPDDAAVAARAVLPRLEHALALLAGLGAAPDPIHVAGLVDELGFAMDHVEQALAGVGWD